jgi:hypothetical protein
MSTWVRILVATSLLALVTIAALPLRAHQAADSLLALRIEGDEFRGKWDIAIRDLEHAIGLDFDRDRKVTWGEIESRQDEIGAYALARLRLATTTAVCDTALNELLIDEHGGVSYASLQIAGVCPAAIQTLDIGYNLMFDLDALHRAFVSIDSVSAAFTRVLSPDARHWHLAIDSPDRLRQFASYVDEGMHHIWGGIDHLLFLLTLMFGTLIRRVGRTWQIEPSLRDGAIRVLGIVSAFTLAHSITLSLAAYDVLSLATRLVETVIAASIIFAALNNVFQLVTGKIWVLALTFGLIHGFGFAGALGDLGLESGSIVMPLMGFNLGVELGQGVVTIAFSLIVATLHRLNFKPHPAAATAGQFAVACIATMWLIDRTGWI